MAYRFKLGEGPTAAVRRIGLQQIEMAQAHIASPADPVVAVHEARKALKRCRALLRLARPAADKDVYRDLNGRLRDAKQMLAAARDRAVMLKTIEALRPAADKKLTRAFGQLHAAVSAAPAAAAPEQGEGDEATRRAQALELLAEAARGLAKIKLEADGLAPLLGGLEQDYRACRKAFAAVYAAPGDEALHEWRKTIQLHWRQMMLMSNAWPGELQARAQAARALSQLLGEDHDLSVLAARVEAGGIDGLSQRDGRRIMELCQNRQSAIRALARPGGERLLFERPARLRARITAYWQAAEAIGEQE